MLKALKYMALRVGDGVLIAIGFSLIYFPTWLAINQYSIDQTVQRYKSEELTEEDNLRITSHKRRESSPPAIILGKVENLGERTWESIRLQAFFYDDEGYFIDKCFGSLEGKLKPNQSQEFKLSCEEGIESSEYKIKVSYASMVRE